jgi:hypothetical protein
MVIHSPPLPFEMASSVAAQTVSGFRLAELQSSALGISHAGQWVILGNRALVFSENAPPVPFLACLDEDPREILELANATRSQAIVSKLDEFPVVALLELAISSNSAHWVPRAILWTNDLLFIPDVKHFADFHRRLLRRFELPDELKLRLA